MLGAVLAGGLSLRMGTNKALMSLNDRAETFLAHVWRILGETVEKRVVATRTPALYPEYLCVQDACERMGPAGALLTCLRLAKFWDCTSLLAIACDLPLIRREILLDLIWAHARRSDLRHATFFVNSCDRLEMLCALYDTSLLPLFSRAVARGERSLFRIVPKELQNRISLAKEQENALINVNEEKDLLLARSLFSSGVRKSL